MNYFDYITYNTNPVKADRVFFNRASNKIPSRYGFYDYLDDIFSVNTPSFTTEHPTFNRTYVNVDFSKYKSNPTTAYNPNPYIGSNIIFKDGISFDKVNAPLLGLMELLASKGVKLRITEGFATSGHTQNSRHYFGNGIDATPHNNKDMEYYKHIESIMENDPDVIRYMRDNNLGYAFEGDHIHYGDDPGYARQYRDRHIS